MGVTLAPKLNSDSDSVPTLAAVAREWLDAIRGTIRPQTWQHYEKHLRLYWLPVLGAVPITDLTRRRIRETMSALLITRAPQTVAVSHSILRMVLSFAVDDELLEQNVAIGLARRLHRPVRRRTTCDLQQLNLFLTTAAQVAPREYPIFVALASSGLRIGEVLGLRREDVERAEPILHIRRTIHPGGVEGPPKTRKSHRQVRLSPEAATILRSIRVGESGWLFPGRDGTKPLAATTVGKLTMRIAMRAGLPPMTPRSFRRSYASVMKTHGAPVAWVSTQLGHASVQVTEGFYLDGSAPPPIPDLVLGRR